MKTIDDLELNNQRVLLRADLNAPGYSITAIMLRSFVLFDQFLLL